MPPTPKNKKRSAKKNKRVKLAPIQLQIRRLFHKFNNIEIRFNTIETQVNEVMRGRDAIKADPSTTEQQKEDAELIVDKHVKELIETRETLKTICKKIRNLMTTRIEQLE